MQAWRVLCPAWAEWADVEGSVSQRPDRDLCMASLKLLGEVPPATPAADAVFQGCWGSGCKVALHGSLQLA